MKNKHLAPLLIVFVLLSIGAGFFGCSKKQTPEKSASAKENPAGKEAPHSHAMNRMAMPDESSSEPAKIFISPERQQTIGVHSVLAEQKEISREIRTVGRVAYDETKVTHIHTKVTGWVQDVFVNFVGQPVRRGQPLFTLYSPDLLSTQEEYLLAIRSQKQLRDSPYPWVAKGSSDLAESAKQRLRLWDVPENEIEQIEKTGQPIKALTIFTPVSGVVMQRSAYYHGTYITPEMELYMIVDLSKVWLLADVYEKDLPFIRNGQAAEIEFPYATDQKTIRGKVNFFYPTLNPQTRTGQVRIELPNPGNQLKPDQYLNVKIQVEKLNQLVVPSDAVLNTGEQQYVFVDLGDGYFEPRQIKVALQTDQGAAIEEGLKEGEPVVASANFLIDSESRLKGILENMGKPKKTTTAAAMMAQNVIIEVLEPRTGKSGENRFVVSVKDKTGQPVTGAEVQVTLSMPAMGSMPPMSSNGMLLDKGNGIYEGTVQIAMAWTWDTVITVRKNGQILGKKQTSVTAR